MKLFKKVTALLIVLNMFPFTAFADTENMPDDSGNIVDSSQSMKHNEEAYKFLSVLGIIDDTFAFQYEKEITRMEFARVVAKAGGYSTDGYEPKGIFSDVSLDSEYVSDIELLYSLGIIAGEGGKFAPARNVTCTEAIIMLLRTAGYSNIVEANGGYPDGYMKIARTSGLLKNISSLDKFTGDDMLVMVYNMLMLNPIKLLSPTKYIFDESETILSKRHSIYYRKGIVSENELTGIYSMSNMSKGEVSIDTGTEKVIMSVGDTDIDQRIGYCVAAYYRYNSMRDKSECVYYEFASKNNLTVIDIDNLEDFTSTKIEYQDGDRKRKVNISGAAIIYNGAYYAGPMLNKASFAGKVGKITAIDNTNDRKCNVVSIEAYDTYIVGNAVAKEQCIYDKETGAKVDISSENAQKYTLTMSDGKDAVFGDICVDTILSVAKSAPQTAVNVVKVIVSTKRASGTLTGTYIEGVKRTIVLDGIKEYNVLPRVLDSSIPNAGNGTTLLLDAFDNVVYVETKFLASTQYGFMVGAKKVTREDKVYIELLTHEGTIENIPLAVKSRIDGEIYRNFEAAHNYLASIPKQAISGGFFPDGVMPVRYMLNDEKELKSLDTPQLGAYEDSNSLTPMGNGSKVFASSTFGFTIPVNGDTTVIEISTPDKSVKDYYQESDRYAYKGISAFRERKVYTYNAYKLDPKSDYADLIVYFSSSGFDHDTRVSVVRKYDSKILDDETGEIFTVFEAMSSGENYERYIAKEYEDEFLGLGLKAGDVVRCLFDDNDRLCGIDGPLFSYNSSTGAITVSTSADGTADATKVKNQETSSFVLMGDVAQRKEGLIKMYHLSWGGSFSSSDSSGIISGRDVFWVNIDGAVPVTVFDIAENGKNVLYSGTYDDITAMDSSFSKHSVVLLRYRSDSLQEVVVINNLYN